MRVLVTGGAGFIGSNLVDALIARGQAVGVIDDLSTGSMANVHANSAEVEHLFRSKTNTVTVEAEQSERSDAILFST
jgi:nucleoside-diphosphate-sugar epimerase